MEKTELEEYNAQGRNKIYHYKHCHFFSKTLFTDILFTKFFYNQFRSAASSVTFTTQLTNNLHTVRTTYLSSSELEVETVTVLMTDCGPATTAAYAATMCRSVPMFGRPWWPPRGLAGHELAALYSKSLWH